MTKVQVLGAGCPKCQQTAANVRAAVEALGVEIDLEKIEKPVDIARSGVIFTPALAVEGKVKVSGRIPTVDEIKGWLASAPQQRGCE